jgi:hypothetical protein
MVFSSRFLGERLRSYVGAHGLGVVVGEAGFILTHQPPTVRGADIAVVLRTTDPRK